MTHRVLIVSTDADLSAELSSVVLAAEGEHPCTVCNTWQQAFEYAQTHWVDAIVYELDPTERSVVAGVKKIKTAFPQINIIVIIPCSNDTLMLPTLRAGATGFLTRATAADSIVDTLQTVRRGGMVMDSSAALCVRDHFGSAQDQADLVDPLTAREEEILDSISEGRSAKEVAAAFAISYETVRTHLKRIYGKLQVKTRSEAVVARLSGRYQPNAEP